MAQNARLVVMLLLLYQRKRRQKLQIVAHVILNHRRKQQERRQRIRVLVAWLSLLLLVSAAPYVPQPVAKDFGWWRLMWNPAFPESRFRREFRMCRHSFRLLRDVLYPGEPFHPTLFKLGVALHRLAHKRTCQELANSFPCSDGSVCNWTVEVVDLLCAQQGNYITFPRNQREFEIAAAAYSVHYNGTCLPGSFGSMDGFHVAIPQPPHGDYPLMYINRKNFFSIQSVATCDHMLLFTCFITGYPGRCNDGRVLADSQLWADGEAGLIPREFHLVADAGFGLKMWCMTPYRDYGAMTADERRYNTTLSRHRSEIERSFARLKGRWRRLKYLDTSLQLASRVLMATAVLHNFCELQREPFDPELEAREIRRERRLRQRVGWLPFPLAAGGDAKRKRDDLRDNL